MNINSLISGILPVSRGAIAPRSTAVETPAVESDTVTLSGRGIAKGSETAPNDMGGVYTRAAAAGTALRQTGQVSGSGDGSSDAANAAETDAVSDGQEKDTALQDTIGETNIQGEPLSSSEMEVLAQLKSIDTAVHTHEMAHLAAAGGYAKGGASYSYKRGPDGRNYAVGGEVMIDTSPAATPEATMTKMQIVRRAALAPADPSSQDQRVAAQATMQIAEAAQELAQLGSQAQAVDNQPGKDDTSSSAGEPDSTPSEVYRQAFSAGTSSSQSARQSSGNSLRGYASVKIPQMPAGSGGTLNLVA